MNAPTGKNSPNPFFFSNSVNRNRYPIFQIGLGAPSENIVATNLIQMRSAGKGRSYLVAPAAILDDEGAGLSSRPSTLADITFVQISEEVESADVNWWKTARLLPVVGWAAGVASKTQKLRLRVPQT